MYKRQVSDCTLDPVFNSATTEYSCTVKNNVTSVTVNATATSTKAKVRGLGAKDLVEGKNTLPISCLLYTSLSYKEYCALNTFFNECSFILFF